MRLESLSLRNFLTYVELDYVFEMKPLQIQGVNLTDENQKSNGSGKSGILSAIEYSITGTTGRGVRDAELINFGADEANINLVAFCPVRNERLYINHVLKRKRSNQIQLFIETSESKEEIKKSDKNELKKFILDWFGINKDDLFNYYFINRTRFKSFFKASNEDNISLINRFSDASIIDGLEKSLDGEMSEDEDRIDALRDKLIALEAVKLEKIESLEYEKNRDLNAEKKDLISSIEEKIGAEKVLLIENESEIKSILEDQKHILEDLNLAQEALDIAQKKLQGFESIDYSGKIQMIDKKIEIVEKENSSIIKDLRAKESSVDKAVKVISALDNQLAGAITCPKCSYKFSLSDESFDYDDTESKKKKAEQIKVALNNAVNSIEKKREEIKRSLEEITNSKKALRTKEVQDQQALDALKEIVKKSSDKLENLIKKKKDLDADIDDIKRDSQSIEATITRLKGEIKTCKIPSNKSRIAELAASIEEIDREITEIDVKISDINSLLASKREWKFNFKRFRIFVANQSLETMQYYCNEYLEKLGSDMKVRFDGFKIKADGKMKEEITATIIRETERTFNSFSGGEQGRLLFASILANKFMIDSTHKYGGLDFLGVDEIFEGVDPMGLKFIMSSISDIKSTIMVITHISDEELDASTIRVVKENGKSRIENQ